MIVCRSKGEDKSGTQVEFEEDINETICIHAKVIAGFQPEDGKLLEEQNPSFSLTPRTEPTSVRNSINTY